MRGYRDPNPEEEADEAFRFEDQFEDDGFGLTFRKYGRGRPVRVTFEERDKCIERFERLDAYVQQGSVAALIAAVFCFILWGDDHPWLAIGGMMSIAIASNLVRRSIWTRTVRRFDRRAPVGPERTFMDQYREKAVRLRWTTVSFAVLSGAFFFWLVDYTKPFDLFGAAQLGVALAGLLALAMLKVVSPRT
jgi:hypothetical protein